MCAESGKNEFRENGGLCVEAPRKAGEMEREEMWGIVSGEPAGHRTIKY
jgi:hypothetical protein